MITLVSIVKSGERWTKSRIDNAGINSEFRGKMDNENAGIKSEVRGKMDKQPYFNK